ncbi:hypothetical protein [Amorphus sp. 3PC139-8]|uniref:hypothetical protein n=1 Tax=Amorphus sp. 3PC139-8 TaxID=2735676 RepID=UPI00345D8B44
MTGAWATWSPAEKRAAVARLRGQGLTQSAAAERLGVTRLTVTKFDVMGQSAEGCKLRIALTNALKTKLDRLADARGILPDTLASRIVTTALRDDLVDAVLDDNPTHQE